MTMKKIKFNIIFVLMAILCAFAFSYQTNNEVFAVTYSNVGTELSLVGYKGYNPLHYFDELTQMELEESDKKYVDYGSYLQNNYYILTPKNSHVFGAISSAKTKITPYSDYIKLAESGCLYVSLRAGIVTQSGDKHTIELSLTTNGKTVKKQNDQLGLESNSYYFPYYFATDYVQVSPTSDISIEIKNLAKASLMSGAKFKLFEPELVFIVKLNKSDITFNINKNTAYYNDMVKLNSTSKIDNVTGELGNYYKQLHSINYEIVEGDNLVEIVGNYLHFIGKSSGKVKIRAKILENSYSDNYVYSDIQEIDYVYEEIDIKVNKNFSNCGSILGEGKYYVGYQVDLKVSVNDGYKFGYWIINNKQYTTLNVSFICSKNTKVELYCYKYLSISNIKVKDKIYDGTTVCEIENVQLEGVENGDNVKVLFETVEFVSNSAGLKNINISNPSITGDVEFYILNKKLPNVTATILQKELTISFINTQKVYGDNDPTPTYEIDGIVGQDLVQENIYREIGEDIGNYKYSAEVGNLNYIVNFNDAYLTIYKRVINIDENSFTKEYDGKNSHTQIISAKNLAFNDEILISLYFQYENNNDEVKQLSLISINLSGEKVDNYTVEHLNNFTLKVVPKEIKIIVENYSKIFGEEDPQITYKVEGLIGNDTLNVQISRETGEDVGIYKILCSANKSLHYSPKYPTSYLTINKRKVEVKANCIEKIYGEIDPEITYQTSNTITGNGFSGKLTREVGENVGEYQIKIGSLFNKNYDVDFISNSFKINKRKIDIDFGNIQKEYDGTTNVVINSYKLVNVIDNDIINLTYQAEYVSSDVGKNNIVFTNIVIDNNNYLIDSSKQISAVINKRKITINPDVLQKTYGENDPELTYSVDNAFSGMILNGSLTRESGNEVGSYLILQGSITNNNNTNFEINFKQNAILTINHFVLSYEIDNYTKAYGEDDPVFEIKLKNYQLPYDHTITNIVTGSPSRKQGENPGVYDITVSGLTLINNNYKLNYTNYASLTITKKDITITAQSNSKVYGENEPELTISVNDNKYMPDLINFAIEREIGEEVGEYNINCVSLMHNLFNITYVPATFKIMPRNITLKVDDKVKLYGSVDPEVTFSIISGILINGDKIDDISTGSVVREEGETVGEYLILQNQFNLNKNYNLTFIPGTLKIEKQTIKIKAINKVKEYLDSDPSLEYEIIKGSLYFGDKISGYVEREIGESVGTYAIKMGTLQINNNYNIEFVEGVFSIQKIKLKIVVGNYTKVYGEFDPEIEINFIGNVKETLSGEVYRKTGEDVGFYEYVSTYNNPNYEIICVLGNLEITKRPITIASKSYEITYGDIEPSFEYEIIDGNIIGNDSIQGQLYKIGHNNVGTHRILSSLNLGRNYQINYIEGLLTVKPLHISLKVTNAEKIYGEEDSDITYEIIDGYMVVGDFFTGEINREQGEDAGEYAIVNNLVNDNYIIDEIVGNFVINKRDINVHIRVKDKVYDGTINAEIETLSATNIVNQEVKVTYNALTSAVFVSSEIQNNVLIELRDIYLEGDKKNNYNLILPVLYANITNSELKHEDITIIANDNTELVDGSKLVVDNKELDSFEGDKVIKTFDIKIQNNNSDIEIKNNLEIVIKQDDAN